MKMAPELGNYQSKLTLPIAPKAVARLRLGDDPAQNSPALAPEAASAYLEAQTTQGKDIAMVELAGPGDPLATPDLTLTTLDLLRQAHPDWSCTLVTHGLGGAELAETLAAHGLKEITLLVEAIDPEVICRLYAWIRPGDRTIAIVEAAQILASEQARTVRACKAAGVVVNIRTTLYPGGNEKRVAAVAARMAELGATSLTVLPFQPGSGGENCLESPSKEMLREARNLAATWLPPTAELRRLNIGEAPVEQATGVPRPSRERPNLAVVSTNGREVDLHLGEAAYLLIYGPREDGLVGLFGTRPAPRPGDGKARWGTLAETLNDCFAVLTVSAGDNPRKILGQKGIAVLTSEGEVEGMVDLLFGGGRNKRKRPGEFVRPNRN